MDPYLEHPRIFPDFHGSLIFCLKEAIQPGLPAPYFAQSSERLWVELAERFIEPDVHVMRRNDGGEQQEDRGGVATTTRSATQPVRVTVPTEERREMFLEIHVRDGRERLRLVTVVEVLSLTNKTPGSDRRDLYLQKQKELVRSEVNLVEIDLLRGGTHSTAVPRERAMGEAGPFDYHVCVHRFDQLSDYYVYPIRLEDRLPEIEIPLLPADGGVSVDLQAVFHRCYDAGPYRRRIRYREEKPVPPLGPKRGAWAKKLIEAAVGRSHSRR
jgi:hypothetical protein